MNQLMEPEFQVMQQAATSTLDVNSLTIINQEGQEDTSTILEEEDMLVKEAPMINKDNEPTTATIVGEDGEEEEVAETTMIEKEIGNKDSLRPQLLMTTIVKFPLLQSSTPTEDSVHLTMFVP